MLERFGITGLACSSKHSARALRTWVMLRFPGELFEGDRSSRDLSLYPPGSPLVRAFQP